MSHLVMTVLLITDKLIVNHQQVFQPSHSTHNVTGEAATSNGQKQYCSLQTTAFTGDEILRGSG